MIFTLFEPACICIYSLLSRRRYKALHCTCTQGTPSSAGTDRAGPRPWLAADGAALICGGQRLSNDVEYDEKERCIGYRLMLLWYSSAYGPVPSPATNPKLHVTTDLPRFLGHLEGGCTLGCISPYSH